MLGLRKIHDLGRQSSHSYVGYSFSNSNVRNSFSYSFGGNMNANELADLLADSNDPDIRRAVAMLRQQQAEIEALKAGKIRAYDNGVEDGRKPNTHPVSQYKAITNTKIEPTVVSYTHPVKELTDEEIIKVYEDMLGVASAKGSAIDFARALLKEAQEK